MHRTVDVIAKQAFSSLPSMPHPLRPPLYGEDKQTVSPSCPSIFTPHIRSMGCQRRRQQKMAQSKTTLFCPKNAFQSPASNATRAGHSNCMLIATGGRGVGWLASDRRRWKGEPLKNTYIYINGPFETKCMRRQIGSAFGRDPRGGWLMVGQRDEPPHCKLLHDCALAPHSIAPRFT